MHRKGTFPSENTCEAFISVGVCIGHRIASLVPSLSHPSILCHYLQPQGADAQQHELSQVVLTSYKQH